LLRHQPTAPAPPSPRATRPRPSRGPADGEARVELALRLGDTGGLTLELVEGDPRQPQPVDECRQVADLIPSIDTPRRLTTRLALRCVRPPPRPLRPLQLPAPAHPWGHPVSPSSTMSGGETVSLSLAQSGWASLLVPARCAGPRHGIRRKRRYCCPARRPWEFLKHLRGGRGIPARDIMAAIDVSDTDDRPARGWTERFTAA
jgi:hypothetical protein